MTKDNNTPEQEERDNNSLPEVEQELSQVASNPKKNLAMLVIGIGVAGYFTVTLLLSSTEQKPGDSK